MPAYVGNCDDPNHEECDWKLNSTIKEINATCHKHAVANKIESLGASCFNACPDKTDVSCLCDLGDAFVKGLLLGMQKQFWRETSRQKKSV